INVFTSDLTKTVPVIPQLVGVTSWMITGITITPQVVTIKGPSAVLEKITNLSTESIDINLLKGTLDKEIALVIPDQVELIETNTKFRIKITTEEMVTIQLKDIPVQILPANHKKIVTLSDHKVNVAITGKKSVVEGWQKFQIFVNIEKLLNGEHTVIVQINQAPAECTIQIFPPKVTVKIMD
ncbi:MAG: CdaR family protein, partial [Caldisericia bacterium]|nr:CdaR family protein [Caldisericia bacterium]